MKIRPKILLLLGCMSLVLVASLYGLSFGVVKRSLLELEAQNARYRLGQVVSEFESSIRYYEAVNTDWSSWDETYSFLSDPGDSTYLAYNINDRVFRYLQLSFFIIYDLDFNIFHYSFYDPDAGRREERAEKFKKAFDHLAFQGPERLGLDSLGRAAGFAVVESEPVLISIQPILHNDFSGPSPGWLLVGQIFDQTQVDKAADPDHLRLKMKNAPEGINGGPDFQAADQDRLKLSLRPLVNGQSGGPDFTVARLDGDVLTARMILPDLTGRPALALESQGPRTIFRTGWKAVTSYGLLIASLTLGFAVLVMFFLERLVLSRLRSLFGGIDRIIEGQNFSQRLVVENEDEFSSLAQNLNLLLSALENLQAEKRQRQLIDIVEGVLNGCLVFFQDRLIYINPEQVNINGQLPLGYSLANYLALYIHPYDRAALESIYHSALSGRPEPVALLRIFKFAPDYHQEPEQKWVQVSARSLDYQNSRAVLLNMVDVTKTKTLEQIVLSREKMASLGHVAAGIAHEIRNPLMGIGLTLDNICDCFDRDSEPELFDMLAQAREATQAIARVVERVLDFSRPSQLRRQSLDIREPIAAALRLVNSFARKNQVEISTVCPESLPPVLADSQFLVELLVNLLTNSIQAMAAQSRERRVIVSVHRGENALNVKIIDSGPGIAAKEAGKVFEPFYTTKGDGSGLGLSICRRIITDHGGTIELTYSHLSGAGFLISLPLGPAEESAAQG